MGVEEVPLQVDIVGECSCQCSHQHLAAGHVLDAASPDELWRQSAVHFKAEVVHDCVLDGRGCKVVVCVERVSNVYLVPRDVEGGGSSGRCMPSLREAT